MQHPHKISHHAIGTYDIHILNYKSRSIAPLSNIGIAELSGRSKIFLPNQILFNK